MKRTQIYLEEDEKRELEKLARRIGTSMGELVREAVSRYLTTETKRKILLKDDPVYKLLGAGRAPEEIRGRKKTNYGETHDEIYTEDWNR